MRILPALCLITATLAAPAARSDEAWMTQFGLIQWEDIRGSTAVFNLIGDAVPDPATFRIFLPGMADDVMGGRDSYEGFWTSNTGEAPCALDVIDPIGTKTRFWGRITLTFVGDDFPSDWAALWGDCFEQPANRLTGTVHAEF